VAHLAHIDPTPVGGTPTLLEAPGGADALPMIRGAASPLIWVVSAKQPYHFFDGR